MTIPGAIMRFSLAALCLVGVIVGIAIPDWILLVISILGLGFFRVVMAADSFSRENAFSEEEIAAFNKEYRKW